MEAELTDHVIVVGYGRVGHAVVRSLTHMERQCVVLDMNPELREAIEEAGFSGLAGDEGGFWAALVRCAPSSGAST